MDVDLRLDCSLADWTEVSDILTRVGMAHRPPDVQKKAFEGSDLVAFAFCGGQLAGFARAISDGSHQAALYDVAVVPEFQRRRVGSLLVQSILSRLPNFNVVLYATPGKENFYRTLGFRKLLTGMALFPDAQTMAARGIAEP